MKKLSVILLAGLILSSCSSLKVITDLDKTVDFSQYKSLEYWGWAENSDKLLNRFDKERIESAFGDEFRKRGIVLTEKGEGDMIVTLYIVTEQKTQKSATTTSMGGMGGMGGMHGGYGGFYGYGPGYGWGGGHSTTQIHEYDYVVGTLIISVFDAKKEELIWEAIGKGEVNEDPNKREKNAPKTAAKIMKDYPVLPLKK